MKELHFQSAECIALAIRSGDISARDALEHFLQRVDEHNPALNAVVVDIRQEARVRADACDAKQTSGEPLGPLHGVPMTVKESYQVSGTPTTIGLPELKENVSFEDALAVQRLSAAGANVFGKTNVPIRLADFQSYNSVYGTTNNPWDKGRTPGGSSGGSAAALAAGLTGLEIGSDIGGSIRNPAHFCGVFGHKPTFGLCPMRGHSPFPNTAAASDLSVIGPLARSAGDLAIALSAMAGPDEIDLPGLAVNLPVLAEPLSGLRIAIWKSDPLCQTSAGVGDRIEAVADALAKCGAVVDEHARPAFEPQHSHRVYSNLLWSAMAARLPDDLFTRRLAVAERSGSEEDPAAQVARAETMRLRDWVGFNEARFKIRWAWRRFFDEVDFLIAPVMPTTAFPHDHRPESQRTLLIDGVETPYFNQLFWAGLATLAFLPATVFPAGIASDGLPVGLQIIGPAYADLRTIALAQRLEAMDFRFHPPPGV